MPQCWPPPPTVGYGDLYPKTVQGLIGMVSTASDDGLGEAIELFLDRRDAERVVEDWDRDEPDHAGLLRIEVVELETAPH